jgi:hypothetical protein
MAIVFQDHHVIILIDKAILVLTREQFIEVLSAAGAGVAGEMRQRGGPRVRDRHRPPGMPPELAGRLVTLFEQHFGVTLRKLMDPQTGQPYVDMAQVCEILGLDVEEERARILADPVLGEGLAIFEPEETRQPPMTPADLQAHAIGICNPDTCRFCQGAQGD